MKELTKEIVCTYLPHSVDVSAMGNAPGKLLGIIGETAWVAGGAFGRKEVHVSNIQLALRPISDLTKKITHNGDTFDPIEELGNALTDENMGYPDNYHDYIDPTNSGQDVQWLKEPWFIVSLLLSWHFDVFGLIEEGLAIDINTLKK